jgi:sugar lactone lactonase YvrE
MKLVSQLGIFSLLAITATTLIVSGYSPLPRSLTNLSRGSSADASPAATPNQGSQPQPQTPEIFAETQAGLGNITVTTDGRVITSLHQFYEPQDRVVEVNADGSTTPFPNIEWTRGRSPDGTGLDAVLGIRADRNGVVWMLDNGGRTQVPPQLVGWNTRTDQLERIISLQSVTQSDSFVNDMAVDTTNRAIYIVDTTAPAMIVVSLDTGETRRVLNNHQSGIAEDVDLVVEGRILQFQGEPARFGANPIALDTRSEWLYYGPMNGTRLYRIRVADLLNETLSAEELAQKVEDYAARPNSDGIAIDQQDNIYITDVNANAIGVIRSSDRIYTRIASADWMTWPDALSFGPDGYLYGVINKLNRSAAFNNGNNESQPPYFVIRVEPLANDM